MLNVTKMPTFKRTQARLEELKKLRFAGIGHRVGAAGVISLSNHTPVDTGEAAQSWYYTLSLAGDRLVIKWFNPVKAGSVPLVILLDVGHSTGTGGYVPGLHFIGDSLRAEFSEFRAEIHRKVSGQ